MFEKLQTQGRGIVLADTLSNQALTDAQARDSQTSQYDKRQGKGRQIIFMSPESGEDIACRESGDASSYPLAQGENRNQQNADFPAPAKDTR